MLVPVLLFILGLALLIKGGDWFVDGATGIAERFHVPELLIGATVVSIGTTLPEVMVSANSALSGHGEIAYGNALGSIICNTALIAAITVAVKPAGVDRKTLKIPVAFFFTAMAIYGFGAYVRGSFERPLGIVLLCIFAAYLFILVRQALSQMKLAGAGTDSVAASKPGSEQMSAGHLEPPEIKAGASEKPLWKDIVLLVIGAAFIAEGADLLVDNGTLIAAALGVPESVIALTFVALGTSLPELVTAITSLAKGHGALSLGNICGANIFNLVLVSGLSVTLSPFGLPSGKTVNIAGNIANASLVVDLPLAAMVMAVLTIPALIKGELKRWQGIVLLVTYASFCVFQFL
ncbi:MAG: calcium/sodium antiporter [Lachnospiraceae bacterium]|nr:calcium/sodium antiporter [Lachnospiraceae bacterium]